VAKTYNYPTGWFFNSAREYAGLFKISVLAMITIKFIP
jgi:hypothetical protein